MLKFYKYHGAGNDFIMINNFNGDISISPEKIKEICHRQFGIGADGVILLESSDKADCFMNYYNSDGSLAEMCGNGIRCTTKFYLEQIKLCEALPRTLEIDTRAGVKKIECNEDGTYSVDMGSPIFESPDFPSAIGKAYGQMNIVKIEGFDFNCVSMGNPHALTFVDNLNEIDINSVGPKIENNKNFPNKINVEFVEKVSENHYKVKVWERGCGETQACGTGACAVYSILQKLSPRQGLGEKEITLEFHGGQLFLSQNEKGHIILRGPAEFLFKGEIKLSPLL